MIDLSKQPTLYAIAVVQPTKISWIEESVQKITWSGSKDTAARTLQIVCTALEDGKTDFPKGSVIILYDADSSSESEIMRCTIVKKNKRSSSPVITYTAYDARWWLVKNTHDRMYENMRADQIVADCCTTFGIPFGSLADTGVKFKTLHFVNKTLWDTIITALTETRKTSGRKYTTKMIKGQITLVEKVTQVRLWVIEQGVNLIDSEYEESIEDMFTQIKVTGKDSSKRAISAVVKDSKAQSLYGTMQKIIVQSEVTTQSEINNIAAQQLKELSQEKRSGSIETIGINGVESGDAIYVIDKQTGLVGGFYVIADEHTVENRFHKMKLTLAWTDELPEISYEPPQTTT